MRARDLLAFGIRHVACNGARFSVFGYDDSAVTHFFAVFLAHHVDLVFAVQLERASIGRGVAGDRIIFAVELSGPDGVNFLPVTVSAVDRAFLLAVSFSQTTIVLLPAPAPKVDLLSFNFHVPNVGLFAKHTAAAATESASVKPIVFVFINFSFLSNEEYLVS